VPVPPVTRTGAVVEFMIFLPSGRFSPVRVIYWDDPPSGRNVTRCPNAS
jgi:hypothetical protein